MFGNLFGVKSKSNDTTDRIKSKSSDFDLDSLPEKETDNNDHHEGEEIERKVYILGSRNSKVIPGDLETLKKLPPIKSFRNSGCNVHLNVHFIEGFKIYPHIDMNAIMSSWEEVMNVFKEANDDEVDNIILVCSCYANILESRRIFLEQVREKIGEDSDRYEHIRSCLEYYVPVVKHHEFYRWAKI